MAAAGFVNYYRAGRITQQQMGPLMATRGEAHPFLTGSRVNSTELCVATGRPCRVTLLYSVPTASGLISYPLAPYSAINRGHVFGKDRPAHGTDVGGKVIPKKKKPRGGKTRGGAGGGGGGGSDTDSGYASATHGHSDMRSRNAGLHPSPRGPASEHCNEQYLHFDLPHYPYHSII